ncbi:MAG: alpha/beta hydrolase [Gammaproteobacteria bacterium]|nr:alpha/beta hydrolase [Gammaproteobacteria bacterium]
MTNSSIEHRRNLCGVECSILEINAQQTDTLVLLHGWLDNLGTFEPLIQHLTEYRIIAVDFPGHGQSGHLPEGMAYHFLDLVYVIQDLFKQFNLSQASIIGHSMGGAAATLFASVSDQLKSLVLLEALGPLTVTHDKTLELMRTSLKERAAVESKQRRIFPNIDSAIELRANHSKMTVEQVRPIVVRGLEESGGGYRWSSDPRLRIASINRLTEVQLKPMLENIQCPCFLVEADDGIFANNELIQQRKTLFPNLSIEQLTGGHHVHLEQPEKVASAIKGFLQQNK